MWDTVAALSTTTAAGSVIPGRRGGRGPHGNRLHRVREALGGSPRFTEGQGD